MKNIEKWEAKEYKTEDQESILEEFLLTQPEKKTAKILEDIERFEKFGPKHKPKFCEKITDNISYIRTQHGSDQFRTFWFKWHDRVAVLTHCYKKDQDKADPKEIKKAEKYRKDWLRRYGNGKE